MSDPVWKVTKRDGREEQFSQDKIINAVRKCFISIKTPNDNADGIARDICNKVLNIMRRSNKDLWDIEDIQRLVIQQLWACNYFDAAEHYTIYREQRRKEREVVHTISSEEAELIAKDVAHFNSDLRYYQFLSKYSRWNEKAKRRETWRESCDRVMNFMKSRPQLKAIKEDIWQELDEGLYNHEATCALRVLQMAGPALERCNMGAYNCTALDINCLEAFSETLYILMQGCGVGFSVEGECIDQLPRIKKQRNQPPIHHQIEDSTEGWCDALLKGLKTWFIGHDVIFDYSLIRLAGAFLKTKGGRASGPEPLKQLLVFVRTKVLTKQGSRLTDVDCHDILCMTGKIVHLGGVRRAAEISISDLDSEGMRLAKFGPWYETAPWRDMSNNSAAYNEKPDCITFMKEWLSLAESGSGERGIANRYASTLCIPKRRKKVRFIWNPCQPGFATVLTPEGIRTFDQISIGSTIWSGTKWTKVTSKRSTGIREVFKWITDIGSFVGTKEHKVFSNGKRVPVEFADSIDECRSPDQTASKKDYHRTHAIIKSVSLGEMPVYDIKVDSEEHSYWTDGLLVSNCMEIILRNMGCCNLSIAVARYRDTKETLRRKVRLATIWGTIQSTLIDFQYVRDTWKINCQEERLLGVDITGQMDCPLLRYGASGRADLLKELKDEVLTINAEFSEQLGIPRSAATTCVKPSGNSGQFFQCSSGVHTRYAKHQIRRFRASLPANDPLTKFMVEQGVTATVDPFNPSLTVLDMLPEPAPEGTPCRNDLTALQQLEYWLETKESWAEHTVSCTIYVESHEWLDVGQWVYKNFDKLTGISFLPKDGGTYPLLPNQEVTEEEYLKLKANFPKIDWSKLSRYEQEDYTNAAQEVACTAQGCDI